MAQLMRRHLTTRALEASRTNLTRQARQAARDLLGDALPDEAFALFSQLLRDTNEAADFVLEQSPALISVGKLDSVERWLGQFRAWDIARRPDLILVHMLVALVRGDNAVLEHWRAVAAQAISSPESSNIGSALLLLAGQRANVELGVEFAEGTGAVWTLISQLSESVDCLVRGQWATAHDRLRQANGHALDEFPLLQVIHASIRGVLAAANSHVDELNSAARTIRLTLPQLSSLMDSPLLAPALGVLAVSDAVCGEAHSAREYGRAGAELANRLPAGAAKTSVFVLLASAANLLGEPTTALTHLEAADSAMPLERRGAFLSERVQELRGLLPTTEARKLAPGSVSVDLTPAETRILLALASPYPVPRIAQDMGISPATVRSHCQRIYTKLRARNRLSAVRIAREHGLLPDT